MLFLFIFLICLFAAIGAGAMACLSDVRGMTIPNSYSVVVIGAFFTAWIILWLGDQDSVFFSLKGHLLAALIIFALTAAMFAVRAIGAADSKLATAYALWMGLPGLIPFVFYTTVAGGVLALSALALRRWKPIQNPPPGSWPARVQAGESKVPYGVAIVAGALASFVKIGYVGASIWASFLG